MSNFPEVSSTQRFKEVSINENFETIDYSAVYGKLPSTSDDLTWGYAGGRWSGFSVAEGTLTLTNTATNYVVVARATGVISVSTSSANWDNVLSYARVYKITVAGGVPTAVEDHRAGPNGVHGAIVGAAAELRGLTFTSDTDSTADSDPGAGLFKWNNATESSATVLYFDNQTADGVSLTTLWGSLGETGFISLQQGDDSTRWQEWKWTALPVDGTGYRKFTVTLQAASASAIQDNKLVLADFETSVPGAVVGPASATADAIARFDGTTGKLTQNSVVTISDTGNVAGVADLSMTGNLVVDGNLTVSGTTVTVDVDTVTVEDPLIKLARSNTANSVDIGFYGSYQPSATLLYGGFFRDATDGKWRLFDSLQNEPTTTVNTAGTGYAVATFVVNIESTASVLSGSSTLDGLTGNDYEALIWMGM